MQIVFIIFGLIIVLSFITGIILTMKEKKKTAGQVLTDDPKILFDISNDEASDIKQETVVSGISSVNTNGEDVDTEVTPVISNTEVITTANDNNKFFFQPLPVVEKQQANVLVTNNIVNTPVSSNTVINTNQDSSFSEEELI